MQPGEVDKQRGRDLASGQRRRTSADYDVSRDVPESQAHETVYRATTFLTEIRTLCEKPECARINSTRYRHCREAIRSSQGENRAVQVQDGENEREQKIQCYP